MDSEEAKRVSKRLSYVLRHRPDSIGIELDSAGWVEISKLLDTLARHGMHLTRSQLDEVVRKNDKQRFSLSGDGLRIRANQGHSLQVNLGYEAANPPEILLHGTTPRFLDAIRREGLKKMRRHHVHLHEDRATAVQVGGRRGQPVILRVRAQAMHKDGYAFFVTPNRVWLTDHVPTKYIDFPE